MWQTICGDSLVVFSLEDVIGVFRVGKSLSERENFLVELLGLKELVRESSEGEVEEVHDR